MVIKAHAQFDSMFGDKYLRRRNPSEMALGDLIEELERDANLLKYTANDILRKCENNI